MGVYFHIKDKIIPEIPTETAQEFIFIQKREKALKTNRSIPCLLRRNMQ